MLLPRWRRFAGAERLSRLSQITLNMNNERVRAAENAPRGPFYVHERRHGLADIVERGARAAKYLTVKPPHPKREIMTISQNTPRPRYRFAQQWLELLVAL